MGAKVAVKKWKKDYDLRVSIQGSTCVQSLILAQDTMEREFGFWESCHHPNIVEFFGGNLFVDSSSIVCAFYANGDVLKYLGRNAGANRPKLVRKAAQVFRTSTLTSVCMNSYTKRHAASHTFIKRNVSMETSKRYEFICKTKKVTVTEKTIEQYYGRRRRGNPNR